MSVLEARVSAPIRIVCPRCALRYAHVVKPDCEACGGVGLLAVSVPADVSPWVAARAATLDRVRRDAMVKAGLLSANIDSSAGLVGMDGDTYEGRAAIGRDAGRLLVSLKLRRPPERKKTQRRSRAEVHAERALQAAQKEQVDRWVAEQKEQRRRRELDARAAAATLEAFKSLHPDEFEEVFEAERAMATISDLPVVNVGGWSSPAVVTRRAQ